MTSYRPHALLSIGGPLGDPATSNETWSINIRVARYSLATSDNEPMAVLQNSEDSTREFFNDTVIPAVTEWWSGSYSGIGNAAKLGFIKFNAIQSNGRYAYDAVNRYDGGNGASGAGGSGMPFQVCRVLTFTTEVNRGRASKGRVFLPAPKGAVNQGTGLTTDNVSDSGVAGMAQLLQTLNETNVTKADKWRCVVASGLATAPQQGAMHYIKSVYADNRFDVQRRRAAQLTGAKGSVAGVGNS